MASWQRKHRYWTAVDNATTIWIIRRFKSRNLTENGGSGQCVVGKDLSAAVHVASGFKDGVVAYIYKICVGFVRRVGAASNLVNLGKIRIILHHIRLRVKAAALLMIGANVAITLEATSNQSTQP